MSDSDRLFREIYRALGDNKTALTALEELWGLHEAMRKQRDHDPLTGLLSRNGIAAWYAKLLQQMFPPQERRHEAVVVTHLVAVAFDVTKFKRFNETFGHAGGDMVLRALAVQVKEVLRIRDRVCRWGGDEFFVLCPFRGTYEAAEALKEKVCERLVSSASQTVECIAQLDGELYRRIVSRWPDPRERRIGLHVGAGVLTASEIWRNRIEDVNTVFARVDPKDD